MGKLIIINKDDARELEFEEILEMYRPLVMSEIHSFDSLKMEFDDKYQVATMGLWRAYNLHNSEKKLGFGNLAKLVIEQQFNRVLQYNHVGKRSGLEIISMDRTMECKNSEDSKILNKLKSDTNIEEHLLLKSSFKEFMNIITPKQKETLTLVYSGKQYKEISEILGVAKSTISMRMSAAKKIFNECMAI